MPATGKTSLQSFFEAALCVTQATGGRPRRIEIPKE
jgi:hypothetical protein